MRAETFYACVLGSHSTSRTFYVFELGSHYVSRTFYVYLLLLFFSFFFCNFKKYIGTQSQVLSTIKRSFKPPLRVVYGLALCSRVV